MNKKIAILALSLCMIAAIAVTGTIAYFTSEQSLTNTFTAGNVEIKLDEAVVEKDDNDNYVPTKDEKRTEEGQEYELHPSQTVAKDPTITNLGSLDAYIGAIVTVKGDLLPLFGVEGSTNIDIHGLVSGGLVDGEATMNTDWNGLTPFVFETDECVIYQDATKGAEGEWKFYVFVTDPVTTNEEVVLFTQLNINADYDNEEMACLNEMEINVDGYATQTGGFEDCFDAMTTAFDTVFAF